MSKGSGRRPAAISAQEFAEKWAQTFGKPTNPQWNGGITRRFSADEIRELKRIVASRAEANADAPPPNEEDAP